MTIFPNEYKLFRVIDSNRTIARIYLYSENSLIYSGEIDNITPEKFCRLKNFLEALVELNTTNSTFKIGLIGVQYFLKGFK